MIHTKKVKGLRVECTFMNGERGFRNYEGYTEEKLRRLLSALGGRRSDGIREVHSITPHEWTKTYMNVM